MLPFSYSSEIMSAYGLPFPILSPVFVLCVYHGASRTARPLLTSLFVLQKFCLPQSCIYLYIALGSVLGGTFHTSNIRALTLNPKLPLTYI
jgi:hypothetical protein